MVTMANLPEFIKPPVVEVVLSVQFRPLGKLGLPQIGELWGLFKERYPVTSEQAPLSPVFERFNAERSQGSGNVKIEFLDGPTLPRVWFLSENDSQLIQLQQDRFICNWRSRGDDTYPRFSTVVKSFKDEFSVFEKYVSDNFGESVSPNQCEVTYINIIEPCDVWTEPGELGKVLTLFEPNYSDDFLGIPETARLNCQYVFRDSPDSEPAGRLHINAHPVLAKSGKGTALLLEFVYRGAPPTNDSAGILDFFETGHQVIVQAFASVTTKEMHAEWERVNEQ